MSAPAVAEALHEVAIARQAIAAVALDTEEDRARHERAFRDLEIAGAAAVRGDVRGVSIVASLAIGWASRRRGQA